MTHDYQFIIVFLICYQGSRNTTREVFVSIIVLSSEGSCETVSGHVQTRQSLHSSHTQTMDVDEDSGQNVDQPHRIRQYGCLWEPLAHMG